MKKFTASEPDSLFFLKVLLYFVIGTIWLRVGGRNVVPIGLLLGLIFAEHDHFRIDRKIEYVVLIFAAILGLIGFGLTVTW